MADQTTKKQKGRTAEILSVLARHNFYSAGFTPEELRTTLEDLGPFYVKLGQILSSRTDILPDSYCKELEKLRSNVRPLPASDARRVIEEETGKKIEDIYLLPLLRRTSVSSKTVPKLLPKYKDQVSLTWSARTLPY